MTPQPLLEPPHETNMYRWVLIAHNLGRWVVLIAGVTALLTATTRLLSAKSWAPIGPQLGRFFSIAVDIQVLMGAALYLILSPLTTVVLSTTRTTLPRDSEAHFFSVVHPAIMIAPFIGVHVSSVMIRRGRSDAARQRRSIILYGVTLPTFLPGMPWWRPWLPLY
jgi:hypothetical protein